jgi:hypothetical protein
MNNTWPKPVDRNDLIEIVREVLGKKCSPARYNELCIVLKQSFSHPDWTELMYSPPYSTNFRPADEIVDLALSYVPVRVEHPLLERLVRAAKKAACELFPGKDWRYVFDPAGLLFCDLIRKSSYWTDPENSAEFIHTGGDGHHFSLLVVDNAVREDSPILLCCPDDYQRPVAVVGENLYDFLCFGMHCAYFNILGVLDYPDDRAGDWYGDEVCDEQRRILQLLRDEFDLKPWTNRSKRFQELQDRFLPLLKMPPTE